MTEGVNYILIVRARKKRIEINKNDHSVGASKRFRLCGYFDND